MPQYLGLDSSTQSLSALVVDTDSGEVVLDQSLSFRELSNYESPHGFLEHADPSVKHANPLLWVAALDELLSRVKASGFDWSRVAGISGAGQQHGSVYLRTPLSEAAPWSSARPLVEQVRPLLSRATAPIWMDSSTSEECAEIASALGGDARVVSISGSRAIERFTGPQIRKFWKHERASYEKTREIHLVSSFMAGVLSGGSAPIEFGDGAGMNLLDLSKLAWSPELLNATAPGLAERLRPAVPSHTRVGSVANYFCERFGFRPGTPVVAFTGDNPSSLVGMGATAPGTAVVSLGTSDTLFAAMSEPRTDPRGFGNVFGNPAGGFMCLICFANGSLAREQVKDRVGLDWSGFERAILKETAPGNAGKLLLPYFVPEVTPKLLAPAPRWFGSDDFVAGRDPAGAARAVVEAQALAMQRYSDWIGEKPTEILATGGAAQNAGILQVIADVLGARVRTLSVANSSALGGALRAAQALSGAPWNQLFERFVGSDSRSMVNANTRADYAALRARFTLEVDRLIAAEST
jgi:xylulokinase